MSELTLTKDIRTVTGGGQLIARAGTVVDFISDEGDYIIAQLKNGSISFPLDPDEYQAVPPASHLERKAPVKEDSLWMNRKLTV